MAEVLVVEDDKDLVYIYQTALAHAGHHVETALSGQQARTVLEDFTPDVVFLDMNMPNGNGIEVIDYIRSQERLRDTRIVVVTANQLWQQEIPRDDIELFLVKPVRIQDLIRLAERLTRR